ncbi:hypothetical protein MiSe_10930 [Microseira wollei NIES-4236]|uniref:Uncharacterized protein n=1 Tax=Microseira wollei NIES-4236 TaxID=2530354 RepID=A0AAV3X6U3_9CYAN|nr:hypothetical protein MiSe_10930 [Microseira wollei NIES-4236]
MARQNRSLHRVGTRDSPLELRTSADQFWLNVLLSWLTRSTCTPVIHARDAVQAPGRFRRVWYVGTLGNLNLLVLNAQKNVRRYHYALVATVVSLGT